MAHVVLNFNAFLEKTKLKDDGSLWRLPLPLQHLSLSQKLGEALPRPLYIHHHAVVLLDVHQPPLPPCWIKKEETSSVPYVC